MLPHSARVSDLAGRGRRPRAAVTGVTVAKRPMIETTPDVASPGAAQAALAGARDRMVLGRRVGDWPLSQATIAQMTSRLAAARLRIVAPGLIEAGGRG